MPNFDIRQIIAIVDRTATMVEQFAPLLPTPIVQAAGIGHTVAQVATDVLALGNQAKLVFVAHPDIAELERGLGSLQALNDAAFARADAALTARTKAD